MDVSDRTRWLGMAIVVGALYAAVGTVAAALAGSAPSRQMLVFWRWSAYVVSALVFVAHVAHEHGRLPHAARSTAWRASVAVAIGGLGLALVANIHDLGSASGYRPRMLIALIAWPLLTAVPAFVAALVVATGLGVIRPDRASPPKGSA